MGINQEGSKEILEIRADGNKGSKFGSGVLNGLKTRGVKTVTPFWVDGLPGIKEAILVAYPFSGSQRCIIHQIRFGTKYVTYKDLKKIFVELKQIYTTLNEKAVNAFSGR